MKKIAFSLLLLTSLSFAAQAQTVFEKTIHAQTSDSTIIALCGTQCFDGGYMLAGYCVTGWYQWQMMLMKVDSLGEPLWKKFYGSLPSSYNMIYGIAQLPDSSFICAGPGSFQEVEEGEFAPENSVIMKVDKRGDLLWFREFNLGNYYERIYNLTLSDTSFIAVGKRQSGSREPNTPSWIIGDFNGENIYINTYESDGDDYLKSASVDADGNFILGGQAWNNAFFIKTDPMGNLLNVQEVGIDYPDQFTHFDHITVGGVHYVCGSQVLGSPFLPNLYTLNGYFEIQDSIVLNHDYYSSQSRKVALGMNQNLFVAGSCDNEYREHELWLMSFDFSLNAHWQRTIGGLQPEELKDLTPTKDGGCLLIGTSDSFDEWTSIYLVKTDSLGQGNYTSPVLQYTEKFIDISIYPNPAKDYCNVEIPFDAGISSLILYNMSGQPIIKQQATHGTVTLNLESIPAGIYVLTDEKHQFRTKLIIQ